MLVHRAQAKIGQLEHAQSVQEDILRLQIAMTYSDAMYVFLQKLHDTL